MNIVGPDGLIFGVQSVDEGAKFLADYGLKPAASPAGRRFEAMDGTYIELRPVDDPALPPPMGSVSKLRKTVYGVADAATLDSITTELARDREVKKLADGSIETADDMGFALGFQVTVRRALAAPAELINAPGSSMQRPMNHVAVQEDALIVPRTLSHVVYFVPDAARAEAFYAKRIGFNVTDRFISIGPFMRPAGIGSTTTRCSSSRRRRT